MAEWDRLHGAEKEQLDRDMRTAIVALEAAKRALAEQEEEEIDGKCARRRHRAMERHKTERVVEWRCELTRQQEAKWHMDVPQQSYDEEQREERAEERRQASVDDDEQRLEYDEAEVLRIDENRPL